MENEFALGEAFEKLIKAMNRAKTLIDGKVTAVNDNFTCDVQILEVPFSNVPVKVLIGSQASIYEIPVVGTSCLVTFRDSDMQRPQIVSFDQVDQYFIGVNSMKIKITGELDIDADQTVFNGGNLGGMVKLLSLVDRMNNIEDKYNDLVSKYNSHSHILTLSSGTGTAAPTTASETPTNITTRADLENTKITQ